MEIDEKILLTRDLKTNVQHVGESLIPLDIIDLAGLRRGVEPSWTRAVVHVVASLYSIYTILCYRHIHMYNLSHFYLYESAKREPTHAKYMRLHSVRVMHPYKYEFIYIYTSILYYILRIRIHN